MNKDELVGNWREFKGEAQRRWGKLTNDQLDMIDGSREKLAGTLQKSYGIAVDEAKKQIDEWQKTINRSSAA